MGSTFTGTAATGSTSYCTLAEMRGDLGLAATDTADDARLETAIEDASRAIDNECQRHFYKDAADVTRQFTPSRPDRIWIDDLVSVTKVETDPDVDRTWNYLWAVTDYILEPLNAAADGEPYQAIYAAPDGDYSFPTHQGGVRVTGKFGWPAVPGPVRRVCLLLAERLWARRNTPLGVMGSGEFATMILRNDPDMKRFIEPYVKGG